METVIVSILTSVIGLGVGAVSVIIYSNKIQINIYILLNVYTKTHIGIAF